MVENVMLLMPQKDQNNTEACRRDGLFVWSLMSMGHCFSLCRYAHAENISCLICITFYDTCSVECTPPISRQTECLVILANCLSYCLHNQILHPVFFLFFFF